MLTYQKSCLLSRSYCSERTSERRKAPDFVVFYGKVVRFSEFPPEIKTGVILGFFFYSEKSYYIRCKIEGNMKQIGLFLFFLSFCIAGFSQTTPAVQQLNGNYYMLGFSFHTRGVSVDGRYTFGEGKVRWCAGLNVSSMKGSKELRIRSLYMDVQDGSRFVYDKSRRFAVISPEFGVSKILFPKTYYNKIEIIGGFQAGISLGFLRPYYLNVAEPDPLRPGLNIVTESQAEPDKYSYAQIVGEVLPWKHLSPSQTLGGVHFQAFTTINLNRNPGIIRGIDLSCRIMLFPKKVPIMYASPNQSSFITFGIGLANGRKFLKH